MQNIPQYGLRAYALFYARHGAKEPFQQSELDWIVSESMKKKIFSLLLRAGWIVKMSRTQYRCRKPAEVIQGILQFRVPDIIKTATRPYIFIGMSAVEIWSDYSYVQRSIEKSPYFVQVLRKDVTYWKRFLAKHNIPHYMKKGSTIGEYIILIPVTHMHAETKDGLFVQTLHETMKTAKENAMYEYPYKYMKGKYKHVAA